MMEQGFNYADSTIKEVSDFFETRVENLEPKEDKVKSSAAAKKTLKKAKKLKWEESNSSVVESSEHFFVEHWPNRKYCILQGKCSHSMDYCNDL